MSFMPKNSLEVDQADTNKSPLKVNVSMGLDQFLEQAQDAINRLEFLEAIEHCTLALEIDAKNLDALNLIGTAFLEAGQPAKAQQAFLQSVTLNSTASPLPWMFLAQLSTGKDALQKYANGVQVLMVEVKQVATTLQNTGNNNVLLQMKQLALSRQISNAYVAMVELYTTDLCDEPNAEQECENLLQQAVMVSPNNCSAFFAIANLRMIQQRGSEAQAASRKCVSLLREIPQLSPDMPSMAMRTSIAKLCMELDLFNDACDILEMLLETTDKYAEVWYLCGVCYLHLNERDSAIEYFTGAGKTLTAAIQSGASDNGLGQSIVEMLKQAQALPSAPQEQKQQQQQQQGNGMDTAE